MQAVNETFSQYLNPFYIENIQPFYKESIKPAVKWVKINLEFPAKVSLSLLAVVEKIVTFTIVLVPFLAITLPTPQEIIDRISGNFNALDELLKQCIPQKVIGIIGLIGTPIALTLLVVNITNLFDKIINRIDGHWNAIAISRNFFLSIMALKDVVSTPGNIANVINLFAPLKNLTWVPILSAISTGLSIATLANSSLNIAESAIFVDELKKSSNEAFISQMKLTRDCLMSINFPAELNQKIDKELQLIRNGDTGRINRLIEEITKSDIDSRLLEEFQEASAKSYIYCVLRKEREFLSKEFSCKGKHLDAALNAILDSGDTRKIIETKERLEGRMHQRLAATCIAMVVDTISIIASVILVVSSFIVCPVLTPVAFGIFVGLSVACFIKLMVEHSNDKEFKKALNIL